MPDPTDLKQEDDSLDLLMSATADPPSQVKKVELDLDDAPFLQPDEKNMPMQSHEAAVPDVPVDEAELARKRKRKKIIIAAGIAAAIAIAVAVWWFFIREEPPVAPGIEPEVIVVPSVPGPAENTDIVHTFKPFVVPVKTSDGKTDFLVCKFSAITKDPNITREVEQQNVALRDAIYYYLRSKDSAFLQDARNGEEIKKDLLSVFNDYLTQGKLEDILFESYLSH